ncbi:MAG: VOC family protein [Syntrophaceae bacterium]|jgi:methylmalonyl-CoA/ethylmalonyl-CoA epimerase|nr:VOC family protein [Syntrophaceae bacterium]HOC59174.1 VOC family protein [Smithellaceae bacterium]
MISRIDHVSIAVKDQEKAEFFFRDILGAIEGTSAADPSTKFFWKLFSLGDLSRLEIISPTAPGSFLDGFLASREAGVHHITLQTPDIHQAMNHLDAHGIPFFGYNEYPGGIWKEIFIHPRNAFGVLIQIAEFQPNDWLSEKVRLPASFHWQLEKTETGAHLVFAHPGGGKAMLHLDRIQLEKLKEDLENVLSNFMPRM